MPQRILVVEDDPILNRRVVEGLSLEHFTSFGIATSGALARLGVGETWDLVLVYMHLPDANALTLLREMREAQHDQVVVMMSGNSSVETAVEAMRLGAYDYVREPITAADFLVHVRGALATSVLRRNHAGHVGLDAVVGESPSIGRVRDLARRVAASDASTVLITGESGTGKDLIARTIHNESARAKKPLMTITCTAISEQLLESELFGHEKGAFTNAHVQKKGLFEVADGGTVFLDEIGDLSTALQAKLLRFLEEKTFKRVGGTRDIKVDVRIIAATHQPLELMVEDGRMRRDLYYRLKVVDIEVPPLRGRVGDIPLLTASLIHELAIELRHKVDRVTPEAAAVLLHYAWPGNVRELRNTLERAIILGEGSTIGLEDLPIEMRRDPVPSDEGAASRETPPIAGRSHELAARGPRVQKLPLALPLGTIVGDPSGVHLFLLPSAGVDLESLEKDLVLQAITVTGGNKTGAGRLLGLNRDQIRYRLRKHGLVAPDGAEVEEGDLGSLALASDPCQGS
jgi:DNA-binding NtrC family response regulator